MTRAADAAWRLGLRVAHRLRVAWWRWRRPAHRGALVALWHGGELLVVRQSYRDGLHLPGGGVHGGEAPRDAARRELAEELGLRVPAEALVDACRVVAEFEYRHDEVHIFELRPAAAPALRPDRREILAAWFMTPDAVLAGNASPILRRYLAERRTP